MPVAEINGIQIDYQVYGDGEPLFLIPGLGGDKNIWFFQINAFKKHYRVVVFDGRGIGNSGATSHPYSIRTMADDTIGLMDHLGIESAHILGVSMGGMIAQEIAISYPDRLKTLVLGSTYMSSAEMESIGRKMKEDLGLTANFSKADTKDVDIEAFMRNVTSLSFNTERYRRIFIPLSKRYMERIGLKGFSDHFVAAANSCTEDRLHRITARTLVITGTEDRVVPFTSSEIIASKIPNAKLHKINGGSHAVYLEMSDDFNKVVLEFLES